MLDALGGLLCLIGALFPPTPQTPVTLDLVGAAVGAGFAAWLWRAGLGRSAWRAHLNLIVYVAATSLLLANAATGEGALSGAFSYVVLTLYAAAFFSRSTARTYTLAIAATSALAVVASDAIQHPFTTWLPLGVTVVASGKVLAAVTDGLRDLATTDPLTGALNRVGFAQAAARAQAAAARRREPLSVVVIDLNGFKHVNDTRGHAAGDRLLVRLHEEWRATLRAYDIVGRRGGDEFVLLLPGTAPDEAAVVAHRLRAASSHTWSYGIAGVEPGADLEAALRRADERMYAHKVRVRP